MRITSLFSPLHLILTLLLVSSSLPSWAANDKAPDPEKLQLASVNALVVDLQQDKEIFTRNPDHVVPIASITKLMTVMVVLDADLPMNERIPVKVDELDIMNNVLSRMRIGSQLRRRDMIHIALMSSENRASATLAHHYPGGPKAFIKAMNAKAKALGMNNTRFVEPTGLSSNNVSTARDLARMMLAAREYPLIREATTSSKKDANFRKPTHALAFYNTNPLVNKQDWSIQLSKTGYIDESGRCLVMLSKVAGRDLAMVLLDSFGKRSAFGDAIRIRRWLETGTSGPIPKSARTYLQQKTAALTTAMLQ